MADCPVARVKLDLSCASPRRDEHNLVWIVVDRSITATIKQFAKLIRTKYGVDKRNELYLEDAWLPPEEPIQILRDRDLVRVVSRVKQPSNSAGHSDNSSEPTPATEEAATSNNKSTKRKREASESCIALVAEQANDTINAFPLNYTVPVTSTPSHDAAEKLPVFRTPVGPATPKEYTASSPALQVPSLPSSALGQHMPSPTLDISATGSQAGSPKKKARRPRRKKKKPSESAVGPIEPLPPTVFPVSNAPQLAQDTDLSVKHLRFNEQSSSDEEQDSGLQQSVLSNSADAAPPAVKAVQEKQPTLTNGQSVWPSCGAGSYTAVPPPSHVMPKVEIQESSEEKSEAALPVKNADSQPKGVEKNYSAYPRLKVPPEVGDRIAFKLLELDSNYCPNVSDYKEGKVIYLNSVSDMIRIELNSPEAKPTYGGKFELETLEEGLPPMEKVVEVLWTELIDAVILS